MVDPVIKCICAYVNIIFQFWIFAAPRAQAWVLEAPPWPRPPPPPPRPAQGPQPRAREALPPAAGGLPVERVVRGPVRQALRGRLPEVDQGGNSIDI